MARSLLLCLWAAVALLLGLAAPAQAQDAEDFVTVELRVTSARAGFAMIDRGTGDGLAAGDRVLFQPRGTTSFTGVITEVQERSAVVKLDDSKIVATPGTRGEARIPPSRLAGREAPVEPEPERSEPPTEHEEWANRDEEWQENEPLLARIKPLHPAERPTTWAGRFYTDFDYGMSSEGNRTTGFYQLGAEVLCQNLFGNGEALRFEGELDYTYTDVSDTDDVSDGNLILQRLSYSVGGTRFEPTRWEFGRFLQYGVPEFGVVDGAEWDLRLVDGSRVGVSAGFMPEPDFDYQTGEDFQVSAYYRWFYDESEQLSASAGYQKTFDDFAADRDLFVFNFFYLPPNDWNYYGTFWVDWYTSGDDAKGAGIELTEAYASASRSWETGSAVSLIYTHIAFPEMDRDEFTPVDDAMLANDHNDVLLLQGTRALGPDVQLEGDIGAWIDQDDSGGMGALGIGFDDVVGRRSEVDFTGFGTAGEFTTVYGGRASLMRYFEHGLWSLEYELTHESFPGFSSSNDGMLQHRLRFNGQYILESGWSIAGYVEGDLFNDELSGLVGIYVQRSF